MTDNKAIATRFFDEFSESGFAAVPDFATDDLVWWAMGFGEIQDKIGHFQSMFENNFVAPVTMIVLDMIAEGDRVAVEVESKGTLKNGVIYNNHYHFKLFFENGKIKRIHEYPDTKYVDDVLGVLLRKGSL